VYGGNGGVIAKLFFDVQPDQKEIITWGSLDKRYKKYPSILTPSKMELGAR
jgi:hypothetical protein